MIKYWGWIRAVSAAGRGKVCRIAEIIYGNPGCISYFPIIASI